ncbi:hypothetical protein PVK06_020544 [Gossypium arboreum]|uniref:Uncharacterized protein n=1 Tax=Gossypium arboreum TaxID=29729 RepID=A0ABR0PN12_GOSAR|nr:hypothetical protein PVK06_020544 [Gossypium arboreum]
MLENLNLSPHLQIHSMVIEIDGEGDDGYDDNGSSDHEVEDYTDPDLEDVPNDLDDERANDDVNVNASLVDDSSRDIVICNDPRAHKSIIDPNATHASEFSKYSYILPIH